MPLDWSAKTCCVGGFVALQWTVLPGHYGWTLNLAHPFAESLGQNGQGKATFGGIWGFVLLLQINLCNVFIVLWMKRQMFWFERESCLLFLSVNKLWGGSLTGKQKSLPGPSSGSASYKPYGVLHQWQVCVHVFLEGLPKGLLLHVGLFMALLCTPRDVPSSLPSQLCVPSELLAAAGSGAGKR